MRVIWLKAYSDMPTPAPMGRYNDPYLEAARSQLIIEGFRWNVTKGEEWDNSGWLSRFSNPRDYDPAQGGTREYVEHVFTRAIRARAARMANLERMGKAA